MHQLPLMKTERFLALCLVALSLLATPVAAQARRIDASSGSAEQKPAAPPAPSPRAFGDPADEARYAAREAASPDAKKYRGGDVIVIGASTLAVILIVVLIIVLI